MTVLVAPPLPTRAAAARYPVPTYTPQDELIVRGEGCQVWNWKGRDSLNFAARIAVNALGHFHPALMHGRALCLYEHRHHPGYRDQRQGLGGGLPIGAMLACEHVARCFMPGTHALTFEGNPLRVAVANSVLDVVCALEFMAQTLLLAFSKGLLVANAGPRTLKLCLTATLEPLARTAL
jgi:acetylornithine/succinyldiaminopimelate/putrescine aminotransferase